MNKNINKIDLLKFGFMGLVCGLGIGGFFAFALAIGQYNSKIWFDSACFWNVVFLLCPMFTGLLTWEIMQEENQK